MILIQSSQQSQGLLIEFKWNRACKHSTKNVSYRSFISKPNVIFKWSITRQKHCVIQSVKWSYCIFIDQLTFVHDLRWLKSAVKDKTLRQNFFFLLILLDLFTKHATTVPRVARVSSLHCSQQLFPYSSCLSLVLFLTLLVIYTRCHCSHPPCLLFTAFSLHDIVSLLDEEVWGMIQGSSLWSQLREAAGRLLSMMQHQLRFFFFFYLIKWVGGCVYVGMGLPRFRSNSEIFIFFFWRMPLFFFQVKLNYHTFTQPMGLVRF